MDHLIYSSRYRNRACENCRQRKRRCDTDKPQCQRCIRSGVACVYPLLTLKPGPKKRSRNDNPTIGRGLLEQPVTGQQSRVRNGRNNAAQVTSSVGGHTAPVPAQSRDSPVLLSPRGFESDSDIDELASMQPDFFPVLSNSGDVQSSTSPVEPMLPQYSIIVHLVEVFFETVQPQFHLLHRPCFLERLHSGSLIAEEHSSLLLNAMFALASRYTDDPRVHAFDLFLLEDAHQSGASSRPPFGKLERWEHGKGFIRRASKIFYDEVMEFERLELEHGIAERPSLLLIQGATLLSYAKVTMGALSQAHSLVSTCVRMAYDAGLDRIDSSEHQRLIHVSSCKHEEAEWVKKEALRHVWWCIWELDSFLGSVKCLPWMIDVVKCQTKLPVDDDDWFKGNEVAAPLLPGRTDQWRKLEDSWHCTSFLGNRIVSLYFLMTLIDVVSGENPGHSCSYLEVEQCVAIWRKRLPEKLKFESRPKRLDQNPGQLAEIFSTYITNQQISILIARAQMFTGVDTVSISNQCQNYRTRLSNPGDDSTMLPATQKFLEAFLASDIICEIVKDWPRYSIGRCCPFIILGFWTPACLQLLVKAFATSTWDLREKALLSFQTFIFVMEQIAEYWGLGQVILSSFRMYEQRLNHTTSGSEFPDVGKDVTPTKRLLSLPSYIDDAISNIIDESGHVDYMQHVGRTGRHQVVDVLPADLWDAERTILMDDPRSVPFLCSTPQVDDWINSALGDTEAYRDQFPAL